MCKSLKFHVLQSVPVLGYFDHCIFLVRTSIQGLLLLLWVTQIQMSRYLGVYSRLVIFFNWRPSPCPQGIVRHPWNDLNSKHLMKLWFWLCSKGKNVSSLQRYKHRLDKLLFKKLSSRFMSVQILAQAIFKLCSNPCIQWLQVSNRFFTHKDHAGWGAASSWRSPSSGEFQDTSS